MEQQDSEKQMHVTEWKMGKKRTSPKNILKRFWRNSILRITSPRTSYSNSNLRSAAEKQAEKQRAASNLRYSVSCSHVDRKSFVEVKRQSRTTHVDEPARASEESVISDITLHVGELEDLVLEAKSEAAIVAHRASIPQELENHTDADVEDKLDFADRPIASDPADDDADTLSIVSFASSTSSPYKLHRPSSWLSIYTTAASISTSLHSTDDPTPTFSAFTTLTRAPTTTLLRRKKSARSRKSTITQGSSIAGSMSRKNRISTISRQSQDSYWSRSRRSFVEVGYDGRARKSVRLSRMITLERGKNGTLARKRQSVKRERLLDVYDRIIGEYAAAAAASQQEVGGTHDAEEQSDIDTNPEEMDLWKRRISKHLSKRLSRMSRRKSVWSAGRKLDVLLGDIICWCEEGLGEFDDKEGEEDEEWIDENVGSESDDDEDMVQEADTERNVEEANGETGPQCDYCEESAKIINSSHESNPSIGVKQDDMAESVMSAYNAINIAEPGLNVITTPMGSNVSVSTDTKDSAETLVCEQVLARISESGYSPENSNVEELDDSKTMDEEHLSVDEAIAEAERDSAGGNGDNKAEKSSPDAEDEKKAGVVARDSPDSCDEGKLNTSQLPTITESQDVDQSQLVRKPTRTTTLTRPRRHLSTRNKGKPGKGRKLGRVFRRLRVALGVWEDGKRVY